MDHPHIGRSKVALLPTSRDTVDLCVTVANIVAVAAENATVSSER